MVVGALNLTLYIGGMKSLKDKRSVVKSLLTKVRSKLNVSAAETGRQDEWNRCELGFCCVTNEASHAESILQSVINFIDSDGRVEIIDSYSETIHI
ncbi:hypothetical protein Cst_c15790 [Thermoclostridium stercorarium subsp. stercorarium DSM 8532]|jgi:uncharacterized protein YlxP (DUF503 family)|uniref:DUF503 domain-containing protein n=3 Tax=Thermoclostridium stercorarium TaxID=1510 RepID=L7VKA2_THES1|nr:DUF503 domain-containing protein [Thermoclostridium stercorarium]AGC68565.1 hypothetical protein Cst_c15790 [Thermoclostridium stercorarium subsp. stercorarium DSM 8532]AGI39581.1 hypothetical protein Clst_1526 [Thermoclostridium stercorarium subsp. stercorarium DSM 8532]ANX01442.1 hypothetical protein CSTERLE_07610 [Thermoclostridium stercorarium subsp. leptospartum DSM 9219]